MTGNPTQERHEAFLNALHKSQETVNNAFDTWFETVRSVTPATPMTQASAAFSLLPDPQVVLTSANDFAEGLYGPLRYSPLRQFAGKLPEAEEGAVAAAPARESAPRPWAGDEAPVYTMRDLNQRTAEVMKEIAEHKAPAFITKHGRFVAMITPLEAGQVESRVLAEMARQINKESSQ
jgi:prevent-host-death family protein